jgi:hypothetical protein
MLVLLTVSLFVYPTIAKVVRQVVFVAVQNIDYMLSCSASALLYHLQNVLQQLDTILCNDYIAPVLVDN